MERFEGNFSYSKKLIAFKNDSLRVIKRSDNSVSLRLKYASLGNESKTGLKTISIGEASFCFLEKLRGIKTGDNFNEVYERGVFDAARYASPCPDFKVFEDTSFWLAERGPLDVVVKNVSEGHEMVSLFINNGHLPEGWDYWFTKL